MLPLPAAVGTVALIATEDPEINIEVTEGLGSGALGAFLSTLIVGVLLMALVPEYTDRMKQSVIDDPVQSVLYGVFFVLGLVMLIVALVLTIVGILVVIPLALLAYVLWAVGSAIAFLAIGERVVDSEDWRLPLLVGALLNGGLALTGVGGLFSFLIGAAGFGAVVRDLLE